MAILQQIYEGLDRIQDVFYKRGYAFIGIFEGQMRVFNSHDSLARWIRALKKAQRAATAKSKRGRGRSKKISGRGYVNENYQGEPW